MCIEGASQTMQEPTGDSKGTLGFLFGSLLASTIPGCTPLYVKGAPGLPHSLQLFVNLQEKSQG